MNDDPYRKVPATKFKVIAFSWEDDSDWKNTIAKRLEEYAAENWEPYLMSEADKCYTFLLRRVE